MRKSGLVLAALLFVVGAASAQDRVYPDAESVRPLEPGARVPSVVVHAVDGAPVDLAARVRERGALLVFYRGGW